MKGSTAIVLLIVGLVAILLPQKSDAVCCNLPCGSNCQSQGNKCHDCTKSSTCCGYGACNIFCCNCDGGCRKGIDCWNCDCPVTMARAFYGAQETPVNVDKQLRESLAHLDEIFAEADVSQDDRLSYEEATRWVQKNKPTLYTSSESIVAEIRKLDQDASGYLTKEEIDPQYAIAARKFGSKK